MPLYVDEKAIFYCRILLPVSVHCKYINNSAGYQKDLDSGAPGEVSVGARGTGGGHTGLGGRQNRTRNQGTAK